MTAIIVSLNRKRISPLRINVENFESSLSGWKINGVNTRIALIKKGSGKSAIQEPEWYKIINPIFSDTHGNLEVASKASDVLSNVNSETDSDVEQTDTSHSSCQEEDGEANLTSTSESVTECVKRKVLKNALDVKPLDRKKRLRSQSQAINEIAKSFT